MRKFIIPALLAFVTLAACQKDKNDFYRENLPPDTKDYNTIPLGAVQGPHLVITYVDWNNKLRIINVNEDGSAYEPVSNPSWRRYSADGDKMVYLDGNSIFLFDQETQTTTKLYEEEGGLTNYLAISADGSRVAFQTNTGQLLEMPAEPGAFPIQVVDGRAVEQARIDFPAFSPDGCHLAVVQNQDLVVANLTIYNDDPEKGPLGFEFRTISANQVPGTNGEKYPIFTSDCESIIYVSDQYVPFGSGDLAMATLDENGEATQVRITNLIDQGLSYPAYVSLANESDDVYFMAKNDKGIYGIYKVSLNGGAVTEIAASVIGPNCNLYGMEIVAR